VQRSGTTRLARGFSPKRSRARDKALHRRPGPISTRGFYQRVLHVTRATRMLQGGARRPRWLRCLLFRIVALRSRLNRPDRSLHRLGRRVRRNTTISNLSTFYIAFGHCAPLSAVRGDLITPRYHRGGDLAIQAPRRNSEPTRCHPVCRSRPLPAPSLSATEIRLMQRQTRRRRCAGVGCRCSIRFRRRSAAASRTGESLRVRAVIRSRTDVRVIAPSITMLRNR